MIVFNNLGQLGRLGNQLFQIAATIQHAENMQTMALFNKWDYSSFFLNNINQEADSEKTIYNGILHQIYNEPEFNYTPLPKSKNIILKGYFQSEKYFSNDIVNHYFSPGKEIQEFINSKEYVKSKNTCSIHIRRTDYLEKSEYHNNLTIDWYLQAINSIEKMYENVKFIIFSDDITWCRQHFIGDKYIFESNKDILDMFLMANCQHHIIANSSFSWWATKIAEVFYPIQQKLIIAPRQWFGPAFNKPYNDIFTQKMTLL